MVGSERKSQLNMAEKSDKSGGGFLSKVKEKKKKKKKKSDSLLWLTRWLSCSDAAESSRSGQTGAGGAEL